MYLRVGHANEGNRKTQDVRALLMREFDRIKIKMIQREQTASGTIRIANVTANDVFIGRRYPRQAIYLDGRALNAIIKAGS